VGAVRLVARAAAAALVAGKRSDPKIGLGRH